jgi:hypothetical protein
MEPVQSAAAVLFWPQGWLWMSSWQVDPILNRMLTKTYSERELYLPRYLGGAGGVPHAIVASWFH